VIWEVAVGEVLTYERELGNVRDRYAVTVKDRTIIGHLTRKVLRVCSFFLRRGGTVRCIVTGITTASIGIDLKCIDSNKIIRVKIISCIKFFVLYYNHEIFLQQNFQIYSINRMNTSGSLKWKS